MDAPDAPPPPSSASSPRPQNDAELEAFRRQWREEVSARAKQTRPSAGPSSRTDRSGRTAPPSKPKASSHKQADDRADHDPPRVYHDLPDNDAHLRLNAQDHGLERPTSTREPRSALEHYEKAVEKETQGSLGDSLNLYRKAFKLDDSVHEKYKNKHFPPSAFPPKPKPLVHPTPDKAHQSPQQPQPQPQPQPPSHDLPLSISQLIDEFSQLSIPPAPAPTDASPPPPCPIQQLPEELLSDVLTWCAVNDLSCLPRIALVCKRFAYLVMTDEAIWKRISLGSEYGFQAMHYNYACDLKGNPTSDHQLTEQEEEEEEQNNRQDLEQSLAKTTLEIDNALLHNLYASSWRQMFRTRPRLRFNGCYISTVNYTRPGAANTMTATWGNSPIHIVTYFRYLRFFRDGSCISLLTTTEPLDVVHHMTKENLHSFQSASLLPNSVMKDALRGRWRLSGPGDGSLTQEAEGDVHIETDGVVPKYMWKMQFSLGSAGRHAPRNNKLNWKGFWSYNRLTDDWGEFGLKNDKAFYFSRVRSYAMGY